MKRLCLPLGVLLALTLACNLPYWPDDEGDASTSIPPEAGGETTATATRPAVAATTGAPVEDKWDLWAGGVHLRGVDLHPCEVFTVDGCAEPITRQDVQDLRNLGANLVREVFLTEAPGFLVLS